MVNLQNIEIASRKDSSDTILVRIYSENLQNCHSHVFSISSNSSRHLSLTAKSHQFETPFARHFD